MIIPPMKTICKRLTNLSRIRMYQTTNNIMMVAPHYFCFNEEASQSNEFMNKPNVRQEQITKEAFEEYRKSVKLLQDQGVTVHSLEEKNELMVPDAVFCNNWFSTCPDGNIIVYPMLNQSRKNETKQIESVERLLSKFDIKNVIHLGRFDEKEALEGTGSMVIDHQKKIIYAAKSERTKLSQIKNLISTVKYYNGFEIIFFDTKSSTGKEYYHTNIVMCVGKTFAIVCLECIPKDQRESVRRGLSGKDIIEITIEQTEKSFCGNAIEVMNSKGESVIVMSERAYQGFTSDQKKVLEKHGVVVRFPLNVIENVGGGSARCMIAEVFLPKK
jgi:hypothetical protein